MSYHVSYYQLYWFFLVVMFIWVLWDLFELIFLKKNAGIMHWIITIGLFLFIVLPYPETPIKPSSSYPVQWFNPLPVNSWKLLTNGVSK